MITKIVTRSLFSVCIALSLPGIVLAEPAGRITSAAGGVDILRAGETKAAAVSVGDAVSTGDIVRTKLAGKAEVRFNDGTVLRLAPETRVRVDEYALRNGDRRESAVLSLLRGKVRALVSKPTATFVINTPSAVAAATGTDFFVSHIGGVTGVIVGEGAVTVRSSSPPDRAVAVHAGHSSLVTKPDASPTPARRVWDADIAPHVRDTSGAGVPAMARRLSPQDSGLGTSQKNGSAMIVDVVSMNVTADGLTAASSLPEIASPPGASSVEVYSTSSTSPSESGADVPITETHENLLTSPVTITLRPPQ